MRPLDSSDGASCPGDDTPAGEGPDAWFHAGTAFLILPVSLGFQPNTFGNAWLSILSVAGTCLAQTPPTCQGGGGSVRRRPYPTVTDRMRPPEQGNGAYITIWIRSLSSPCWQSHPGGPYSGHVTELPIDDAAGLASAAHDAAERGQVVYLTDPQGRRIAAIVPASVAAAGTAAIEALEDAADLSAAEDALAEWDADDRRTYRLADVDAELSEG
jgi:hypothetical protein